MPSIRFHLLFLLSGSAALGYQIIWTRMFSVGLGHEMAGVISVVAAFFAGTTIGSWFWDQSVSRSSRPGRIYGLSEIVIGMWAIISAWLIPIANEMAWELLGPTPSPAFHTLIGFLLPFLCLCPATIAMGITFPAMDRLITQASGNERNVGALYSMNTIGALAGVIVATFFLGQWIGWSRSLYCFSGLNLISGIGVLSMSRTFRRNSGEAQAGTKRPEAGRSNISNARLVTALVVTGFLGIGLEVVGIRVLSLSFENTIYTFGSTLAIYLLGTACGAGLFHKFAQESAFDKLLPGLLIALSVSVIASSFLMKHPPANQLVAASLVFLVPTLLMGAVFSLLVQQARRPNDGVGKAIALNTVGSAFAPIVIGLVLIPMIGAKACLATIAIGYLCLLPRFKLKQCLFLIPPCILLSVSGNRFSHGEVPETATLLSASEGVMASVTVFEEPGPNRVLRVNGRYQMGGTAAVAIEWRQAHMPLLLHPSPRSSLFLGLGTGISVRAAATHPELSVDGVELVPEIVDAMRWFDSVAPRPAPNSTIKHYTADARRFVSSTTNQYNVIVADLFHPARDGAAALYSLEHFKAVKRRLTPDGLFCQWLPLHQLDFATLKSVVRTFLTVFPETTAYLLEPTIDSPALGLIGSAQPVLPSKTWFDGRISSAVLSDQLTQTALTKPIRLFGSAIMSHEELIQMAGNAPLNTDDTPYVLFAAPKASHPTGTLKELIKSLPRETTGNDSPTYIAEVKSFRSARNIYLDGMFLLDEGRQEAAIDRFIESAQLSKDFTRGYAQCLSLVSVLMKSNPSEAKTLLRRLDKAQPSRPVARQLLQRLNAQ